METGRYPAKPRFHIVYALILISLISMVCSCTPSEADARKDLLMLNLSRDDFNVARFKKTSATMQGKNLKLGFTAELKCIRECAFFIQPGTSDLFITRHEIERPGQMQFYRMGKYGTLQGIHMTPGKSVEIEGYILYEKSTVNKAWIVRAGYCRTISPPGFGKLE
jgi:hypothetical protein